MGLRSRPLWNRRTPTAETPPPEHRAPHSPDRGESSGLAPNILEDLHSNAAAIEEGANEDFSFVEMLEGNFQNVENVETAEAFHECDMPNFDLPGIDTPSDAYSPELDELGEAGPCGDGEEPCAEPLDQTTVLDLDVSQINLDSCIRTSLNSLPFAAPKPIWEEGVWASIFGDGIFMKPNFCTVELSKPSFETCMDEWIGQIDDTRRKLKRALQPSGDDSYGDVVKHIPDQTWQEERESMLQTAIKRWLVVVIGFSESTVVWQQLASEPDDVGKLTVLGDLFRGKAPATLLKRVRAVEKMCQFLGVGIFPASESKVYKFFTFERAHGAPVSRLRSYLEALALCYHVFSMTELKEVISGKRLHGCTISDTPALTTQASPLTVEELLKLHKVLFDKCDWNSAFAGAALFVIYSRARWADAMHCCDLVQDQDEEGITRFLEGPTAVHKTMHSAIFKHKMLPLVAPAVGVSKMPWTDRWFAVREALHIKPPPDHAVMPAPTLEGLPSARPLTATEAGAWLRKLLHGHVGQLEGRKVTAHSMKATMLSYAAKFGLDAETRLQLAYHVSGFKMLHTYSRDAAAQPLMELERVLKAVRGGSFRPDSTRSGRFVDVPGKSPDLPLPVAVDLTEPKVEEAEVGEEAPSSSSDGSDSEEEFPKSQGRLFRPPTPPDGYVFWQHRKMRTLHLALPSYKRVFMCNRAIGPLHISENMSIRYDTPVCRNCAAAVKE